MKVIAYNLEGSVHVCIPQESARGLTEAEAEFLARIQAKDIPPEATNITIVNSGDLPKSRAQRNGWRISGRTISALAKSAP